MAAGEAHATARRRLAGTRGDGCSRARGAAAVLREPVRAVYSGEATVELFFGRFKALFGWRVASAVAGCLLLSRKAKGAGSGLISCECRPAGSSASARAPQRGLAGHRAGRQAAPRHRLRRLLLGRLGVGRPGHRPGHADPDPLGPRRRGLGRRRRHPLPQARRQGRLRRHLPRRRALVEEAQDLPVRPELGRAGHRRADAVAPDRYFCLPVLWRLYRKKGQPRLPDPPPGRRRRWPEAGRGQPRADLLAGRRQRLRQRGVVAGPAGEPPGDRAVALEGGAVRPARPASAEAEGGVAQEGGSPAEPQGDDRGHGDLPRRVDGRSPSRSGRGSCGCR